MGMLPAILVAGTLLVAMVALHAYGWLDPSRLRGWARNGNRRGQPAPGHETPPAAPTQDELAFGATDTAEIHSNEKKLSSEHGHQVRPVDDFERTLDEIERVASAPLDLALKLGHPETGQNPLLHAATQPDALVDFTISLPGEEPVERDAVLRIYREHEFMIEKPHGIYGRGCTSATWTDLTRDGEFAQYGEVAAAMQLADGNGPANETDINTLVQLGLKLADALKRPTRLSMTVDEAVARARDIDSFCEQYDVLASISLRAHAPIGFHGHDIDQAVTRAGLRFGAMNIYHMKNPSPVGNPREFSLANLYEPGCFDPERLDALSTRGLALFLNVPCTADPSGGFERMIDAGMRLARDLDGELCDSEGRALGDHGIALIRAQIERIVADMRASGIHPGSDTALRLFR